MSERGQDTARRLSNIVSKLDDNKQNYLLGVAEGMVIAKESNEAKTKKKVLVSAKEG